MSDPKTLARALISLRVFNQLGFAQTETGWGRSGAEELAQGAAVRTYIDDLERRSGIGTDIDRSN